MGYDMYFHNEDAGDRDAIYFRLNIGGMGRTAQAMFDLGMVFEASNRPTREDWDSLPIPCCEDDPEYDAAVYKLVSRLAAEEVPGIPVHKLYSTNDGWHVQPIEIRGALAVLAKADPEDVAEARAECSWWDDWIDYLTRAANEGEGFRVN